MEITYESEKERLLGEMMYLMEKQEWPYIKECFASYCNLEDEDKERIIEIDKRIQLEKESKLYKKDDVLLCTAYFFKNSKELCNGLSDEELILFSEYYLYSAVANSNLGRDKKDLFKFACDKRKDTDDRMIIVQLGEDLLQDKEYSFNSINDVCDYIENMNSKEIIAASTYYMHTFINSKEGQKIARGVRL